ncbi:hypothetical protein ACYOEI_08945, partial [Singulisphaera rosea]
RPATSSSQATATEATPNDRCPFIGLPTLAFESSVFVQSPVTSRSIVTRPGRWETGSIGPPTPRMGRDRAGGLKESPWPNRQNRYNPRLMPH